MTQNSVPDDFSERLARVETLLYDAKRVKARVQPNLRDLNDTALTKVKDGQVPAYNKATGLWKPVTMTTGGTPTLLALRGAAVTTDMMSVGVTGDAFDRWVLDADGTISIGDGGVTPGEALRLGSSNTVVGRDAASVGFGSTAVGASALKFGGAGSNTAVGLSASRNANTNSSDNVAVGAYALTTAGANSSQNVAIGYQALKTANPANGNVAVGYNALQAMTTGSNNLAVGTSALSALTTGAVNAVVGNNAGLLLTTGTHNVALGVSALTNTTTGSRQVAVGSSTGQSTATQRNDSIAVGYDAKFDADNACSLGSTAQALHAGSTALGQGTVTTAADQVMIGARDLEITLTTKGVVLLSPNGTRYRIQVANGGALSTVAA